MKKKLLITLLVIALILAALFVWIWRGDPAELSVDEVSGTDPTLVEGDSQMIPTVAIAEPVGWAEGELPDAPTGYTVNRFAEGLEHPRVLYTLPNGDVLVTLTRAPAGEGGGLMGWIADKLMSRAGAGGVSPDQLVLLRDADGDGVAEVRTVLRDDLASPSGIAWEDGKLWIANHDALLEFDYALGAPKVTGTPRKLMDLPAAGNHWMRNIAKDPDEPLLYIAVGSASNIGENGQEAEEGRAMIWSYDLDKKRQAPWAVGLRNANGLAFAPWSGRLWTTVNERDMLGSDLVPDYLTDVPFGANYGWPWVYWRFERDMRVDWPMPRFLEEYARKPVYAMGPHVAALGLAFTPEGHRMGETFGSGAFVARHGSWNRKPPSGYDVVFVDFDERGRPVGTPQTVLGGFLTGEGTTRGRPTWVAFDNTGALIVSDDTAGIIWRVIKENAEPAPAIERLNYGRLPSRATGANPAGASFGEDYARTN